MRKQRKGKAADAAVPSLNDIPRKQVRRQTQIPCMHCKEVPAKDLNILGYKQPGLYFCSTLCATMFAHDQVFASPIMWCNQHLCWTDTNGNCMKCIEQRELARPDGHIVEMPDQVSEGEVNHVN